MIYSLLLLHALLLRALPLRALPLRAHESIPFSVVSNYNIICVTETYVRDPLSCNTTAVVLFSSLSLPISLSGSLSPSLSLYFSLVRSPTTASGYVY